MINKIHLGDMLDLINKIDDNSIDCVVTDCPYKIIAGGVTISKSDNEVSGVFRKRVVSDGTKCSNKWLKKDDSVPSAVRSGKMFDCNDILFKEWLPELYRVLKNNTHCYIMINGRNLAELQNEAEKVGFIYQNLLVWIKGNATPNKYYMQGTEFILMFRKGAAKNINNMGTTNIFNISNVRNKTHPTEKPTELLEILIENSTNINDIVLEPFAGSGSTVNACINTNRKYIAFEKDKKYFDVAIEREKKAKGNVGLFA